MSGILTGCKDPTLADKEIPPVSIGPVQTPYGVTLDENATPADVAYVFFRAAKDDYLAAQEARREDQKKAFHLQIALAAADDISNATNQLYARKSLPVQRSRDEAVYLLARVWAPTIAHYINNFSDDRSVMQAKMVTGNLQSGSASQPARSGRVNVLLDVSRDDSNARIQVSMIQQTGGDGKRYWRISEVGFADPRAKPTSTAPAR